MDRKINFYAGPSLISEDVLKELSEELVLYKDSGLSLIETSHRSPAYDKVHTRAMELIRELYSVPENYKILFLGGGATMQFSMIPMNLLGEGKKAAFTLTGAWAKKAYADACKVGDIDVVFDGSNNSFTSLPDPAGIRVDQAAEYLHITSNETIGGIQWKSLPDTGDVPLVIDMSSDILSKPVDFEHIGMIYAGAQKNLGPSGLAVVIIRDDLLEKCSDDLTVYLSYKTHAKAGSLYNTPPVFPIWAMMKNLEKINREGGLEKVVERNERKAALLYDTIDQSGGFYRSPVAEKDRSLMNVVFTLKDKDLESQFIAEATAAGMVGLKGHRSVGGCRASIYNFMPEEGVKTLVAFMNNFSEKNA